MAGAIPSQQHRLGLAAAWLVVAAALGLSAVALIVSLSSSFGDRRLVVGLLHALLIATPVTVGVYALHRDPGSRFALLLVAMGFLWTPSLLAGSDHSIPYSIGRIASWFVELGLIVLLLTFPSGRLRERPERVVAIGAAAVVGLLYLPLVLLLNDYPAPSPWSACGRDCPSNAFALTHWHFADSVLSPAREGLVIALFLAAAVILALKAVRASRPMR